MHLHQIILKSPEPCHTEINDADWQHGLPSEWRAAAITPFSFASYREYEIPATRTLGYDQDGDPCYCRLAYLLGTLRSDNDEEFYEAVVYGEEVHAWRLRGARWLIWRIEYQDDYDRHRGAYNLADRMPQ